MTWREFQLRKAGYEREQLKEWQRARMIAYFSGYGQSISEKNILRWLPLKGEIIKPKVSDEHRESFNKAMQDYKNKVNGN